MEHVFIFLKIRVEGTVLVSNVVHCFNASGERFKELGPSSNS